MIHGLWSRDMIGWMLVAACLPVAVAAVVEGGTGAAVILLATFVTASLWQILFRQMAGIALSPTGVVMAVAMACLAPDGIVVWQVVLATSIGIVLAELIFGGWGRNVVNAPTVALALVYLSFPGLAPAAPGLWVAAATLPAAAILLLTGVLSLSVVLAALAGLAAIGAVTGAVFDPAGLAAVLFAIVFLVGDPVTAASTRAGRWLTGALAGGLAALFATGGTSLDTAPPILFAALLAAIFAPLIDFAVIRVHVRKRARSHG